MKKFIKNIFISLIILITLILIGFKLKPIDLGGTISKIPQELFTRSGTTISPKNSGDDLDMGEGSTIRTNKIVFSCPEGGCDEPLGSGKEEVGFGGPVKNKEGFDVYPDHLNGCLIAEDYGCIELGNPDGLQYVDYIGQGTSDPKKIGYAWGVINDGNGNLSGLGFNEKTGYCNFWVRSNGKTFARATVEDKGKGVAQMRGYIWCANVGYIDLDKNNK